MTEVPGQLVKYLFYLFCYGHLPFIIFKIVIWYRNLCQLQVSVTPDFLVYHHHCNYHCYHWIYNKTVMVLQIWKKLERRLKFLFFLSLFWPLLNIFCKDLKTEVHSPTKYYVRFLSFSDICFTYTGWLQLAQTHTNICNNINTDEFWNSETLISTQKSYHAYTRTVIIPLKVGLYIHYNICVFYYRHRKRVMHCYCGLKLAYISKSYKLNMLIVFISFSRPFNIKAKHFKHISCCYLPFSLNTDKFYEAILSKNFRKPL